MKKSDQSATSLMESLSAGYRSSECDISRKETYRDLNSEKIGNLIVIAIVGGFVVFLGGILLLVEVYF